MNERIRQLAEQARRKPMGNSWTYAHLDEFEQRFAELIVKDCADIADTEKPNYIGCGYITISTGKRIKNHFGVE